jgi:hypothetical protein
MCIYQGKNYTYLIGWSKLNKYYYGVRYSKNCHPTDFWVKYFTSSKLVKHFIKIHGEPDIREIRKTFSDPEQAVSWESRVLKRMNVPINTNFLNGHCAGAGYRATRQASKVNKNSLTVVDENGNHFRVSKNDPRLSSGELKPNRKGKVSVKLVSTGEKIDITTTDFTESSHLYIHHNKGKTRDLPNKIGKANYYVNGVLKNIPINTAKSLGLKPERENKSIYKNINTGEIQILDTNSPLIISGEFVGINKGISINKGPKIKTVCCLESRKEFTLSCWIQHIRAKDKKSA